MILDDVLRFYAEEYDDVVPLENNGHFSLTLHESNLTKNHLYTVCFG